MSYVAIDYEDLKSGFAVGKAAALAEWRFRKEQKDVDFAKLCNRLYWRKWRAANPERAKAYGSAWRNRDKEHVHALQRERKRRWQQKNRDAYNAQQRAAYARRKARKVTR